MNVVTVEEQRRIQAQVSGNPLPPEPPANEQVTVGIVATELLPIACAIAGWVFIWIGIGMHFGGWLMIFGGGIGMLLAGLGVLLRDAVAGWAVAYFSPNTGEEGSSPKSASR